MRLPIQYLANLLTAGDTKPVKEGLQKMAMMRSYMRSQITNQPFDTSKLERLGLTERQMTEMYRLLGIAKYEDRFVVPSSHKETYLDTYKAQGSQGYGGSTLALIVKVVVLQFNQVKLDKKFIMKISMEDLP